MKRATLVIALISLAIAVAARSEEISESGKTTRVCAVWQSWEVKDRNLSQLDVVCAHRPRRTAGDISRGDDTSAESDRST